MGNNFFKFKQFEVSQAHASMKVNTDACILGACLPAYQGRILDVGTGTGVIALMLAQKSMARIDAVEINAKAAQEAQENFEKSAWSERLSVFCGAFQEYAKTHLGLYDVVVSNPPYFVNAQKAQFKPKNQARHTDDLSFEDLIKNTKIVLKNTGYFVVILPIQESNIFYKKAIAEGFFLQKKILIQNFPHTQAFRQISFFAFEPQKIEEQHFFIYEKQGIYSAFFRSLLADYYLYF